MGASTRLRRATRGSAAPVSYVSLPGTSGNYANSSDAAFGITGDIEIIVKAALTDWTPSAEQTLIAKWRGSVGHASYLLSILANGNVQFAANVGGSARILAWSGAGFTDGTAQWLRCTRVSATGVMTIYSSPDGSTWTSRATSTLTTGAMAAITDSFTIGAQSDGTALMNGKVYYADVRSTIGGSVTGSFTPATVGATSATRTPATFTSTEGAAWVMNGSAWTWG